MHWFDVGATILLILFGVWGLFRGLRREVMSLLGLLAAFVLSARGYPYVAQALSNTMSSEWARQAISVALIFIVVMILAAIVSRLLRVMIQVVGLSIPDRLLGGVFGLLKVAVIVSGFLIVCSKFLPAQWGTQSVMAPVFFYTADLLSLVLEQEDYEAFKQLSGQALQPLQKLLPHPQVVPGTIEKLLPRPATPSSPGTPRTPTQPQGAAPQSMLQPPAPAPGTSQEPPSVPSPPVAYSSSSPPALAPPPPETGSGISEADSKALEKLLRERLQERQR